MSDLLFKVFYFNRHGHDGRKDTFEEVAFFATSIGRANVVNIAVSVDEVTVWYWED